MSVHLLDPSSEPALIRSHWSGQVAHPLGHSRRINERKERDERPSHRGASLLPFSTCTSSPLRPAVTVLTLKLYRVAWALSSKNRAL